MVEAATGGVAGGTAGGGPASADGGVDNNGLVVAEGSSSGGGARRRPLGTLADVMREPSTTVPDVVVLDTMPDGLERREALDPREDLWLSTSDGYVRSRAFLYCASTSLGTVISTRSRWISQTTCCCDSALPMLTL